MLLRRGNFYVWYFSKSLMRCWKNGIRGFPAIALMSVLAKCYAAVVVGLLHEGPEPGEWKELHVGDERGINAEHMQALLTNV